MATYVAEVLTTGGQAHENAALRGADRLSRQDALLASERLGVITVGSLALAVAVIAVVALVRKRLDLAVAGVGVVVAGQVITQSLKRFVLPRPALVEVVGDYSHNSFPSGHTTIAMTVLIAAFLVVPYRWRGIVMLFVLPWATSIGAYTVSAKWHRLSDTIGASAIALFVGCVASWWLAHRGRVVRYTGDAYYGRMFLIVIVAVVSAALLTAGGILWFVPEFQGIDFAIPNETTDYTAYLGANSLAGGFSGLVALTFWGLWHRLEIASADGADVQVQ